jgi:hypothetical protein
MAEMALAALNHVSQCEHGCKGSRHWTLCCMQGQAVAMVCLLQELQELQLLRGTLGVGFACQQGHFTLHLQQACCDMQGSVHQQAFFNQAHLPTLIDSPVHVVRNVRQDLWTMVRQVSPAAEGLE